MTAPHPLTIPSATLRWEGRTPVSEETGDVYFSRVDGVRESTHVFIDGSDLNPRFQTHSRFQIGELGFGTGLNFLLALQRFREHAAPSAQFDFVTFEHRPLTRADARRFADTLADAGHRSLARDAQALALRLPPRLAGWHRIPFEGGRVRLSMWLGDALTGMQDWLAQGEGRTEAWFLDGFAPRLDPDLWSGDLFAHMARLSAPAASIATFSAARDVRDALGEAGFEVERVPGILGKREVLRGRLRRAGNGLPEETTRPARVTVVGAGLAGATTARALAIRGVQVEVRERHTIASGASGVPRALLHPRLPVDDGPRGPFLLGAMSFARNLYRDPQLAPHFVEREIHRHVPDGRPNRLADVAARFGPSDDRVELVRDGSALALHDSGVADLPALVHALLDHPRIEVREGHAVATPLSANEADHPIVLCTGIGTRALLPAESPFGAMRGQMDGFRTPAEAAGGEATGPIFTGSGQWVPETRTWWAGASYVREDESIEPRDAETAENLARIEAWREWVGTAAPLEPISAFVGIRCTVPDRLPLVGWLGRGVWINAGHASGGMTLCPIAAEHVATTLLGGPPILERTRAAMLSPERYVLAASIDARSRAGAASSGNDVGSLGTRTNIDPQKGPETVMNG